MRLVAPDLVEAAAGMLPEILTRLPLLTLINRPAAWVEWSAQPGIELGDRKPHPRYAHFAMLAQAAAAGAGAALIPDYVIEDELHHGRLVAISPIQLDSAGAYGEYTLLPLKLPPSLTRMEGWSRWRPRRWRACLARAGAPR